MTANTSYLEAPVEPSHELEICILQGVARSGKTTISRALVEAYGFKTIGVGTYFRGVTAYYLESRPDQIDAFEPDVFTKFMEDEADKVQAVLAGTLVPARYALESEVVRKHVAELGDKTTIIHDVINEHVCNQLMAMNQAGVDAVFLEGRAWDQILEEKIKMGMKIGRIIANLFVYVSDEGAVNRQEAIAKKEGVPFDKGAEFAHVIKRNKQDREREKYPMRLDPDAYEIDKPIDTQAAASLGAAAIDVVSKKRPIPRCIHITTDDLTPEQAAEITRSIISGASPVLAEKAKLLHSSHG